MAESRSRSTPTDRGSKPLASSVLVNLLTGHTSAKKKLVFSKRKYDNMWTTEEEAHLVEFLFTRGYKSAWPKSTSTPSCASMWEDAARYLAGKGLKTMRTSGGCRARVILKLASRFASPEEAHCGLSSVNEIENTVTPCVTAEQPAQSSYSPISIQHSYPSLSSSASITTEDFLMDSFRLMPSNHQVSFIGEATSQVALDQFGIELPKQFIELALSSMQNLDTAGRSNVIYGLCKGLGSTRKNDSSETLFPIHRMPMGLLEYMVKFFTADSALNTRCPPDYASWLESMYCLFGTKWTRLFRGPCWSQDPSGQDVQTDSTEHTYSLETARVNVPAPSTRTLQHKIAESEFSVSASIQEKTLVEAHLLFPHARWWIKADGVDLLCSLEESVRGLWNGDVDLDDGSLQQLRLEYEARLAGVPKVNEPLTTKGLEEVINLIEKDLEFVSQCLEVSTKEYETKLASEKQNNKALYASGWKSQELSKLAANGRHVITETHVIMDRLMENPNGDFGDSIQVIVEMLTAFITGVYRHRRTAATHLFAVLISTEDRKHKPYALPVQMIPYVGLSHGKIRKILNRLIQRMTNMGMKVIGFVSNGEHNQLRSAGYTRPVSIFKIKADVHSKYSHMSNSKLKKMITPTVLADGSTHPEHHESPVPHAVLLEVSHMLNDGLSLEDAVDTLRCRTVPSGYPLHTWREDQDEDMSDKLRAILSQFEFGNTVRSFEAKGIPFCSRLYVPEKHPITNDIFYEREDEGHVFKRVGQCTRRGGPDGFKLERFTEALFEPSTKLTYPAVTGQRKQSVRDVEILFSEDVEEFMEKNGYTFEATYIRSIRHWRMACDTRGLGQLERCRFNYELLNLILSELMPWYASNLDFSTMEVTRPVSGILGFTRQVIIALTTNIEGREWRRCQFPEPEHPRASTTDDVECFFSLLRDMVGKHFTLHIVKYNWKKLCIEFGKRMDPCLPFYYYTSSHDRFYEGERPSFDIPGTSKQNPRNQRARRIEQLSDMQGRVTLPKPGDRSIRMKYHNVPVEHVPPPSQINELTDHSYCN